MSYFRISFTAIILLFLVFAQNEVYSQNTNDALRVGYSGLGSSARALGMGNSYIGLSDDASAAFFNPAGFGLIKKIEFSGGLSYVNFKNNAEFFKSQTELFKQQYKFESNKLSISFPHNKRKSRIRI